MQINCLREPDEVRIITDDKTLLLAGNGTKNGAVSTGDLCVEFKPVSGTLQIRVTADQTPVRFVVLRFQGELKDICSVFGDAFERGYGNLEWRGCDPFRLMAWYTIMEGEYSRLAVGTKVQPNAMVFFTQDSGGISVWLDIRCGTKGVRLRGRTLAAASLVQMQEEKEAGSCFSFCRRFTRNLCDTPLFPATPVYGSNNWYYAYGNTSDAAVRKDAELLAQVSEGLSNRPYLVIDDGWQELALTRGAAGRPYERGNTRFPDMPGLAEKIRENGVRPGLWIRPLETQETFLSSELRSPRDFHALDPSVPEALELIAEDVRRVTSWGYEFIKYDFATFDFYGEFFPENNRVPASSGWTLHNTGKTSAECIKEVYRTIYENAGTALLLGCNVIGHLAAGWIHLHRSGDDTSGHSFDRTVRMGVNTLSFRFMQHKAFFYMDADCVGITTRIPWEYNRKFLEFLADSSTPLFISLQPEAATTEVKKEIHKQFAKAAVQEQSMEPLDWMRTRIPQEYEIDGHTQYYTLLPETGPEGYGLD